MGLDMNLYGRKFFWTDYDHPENNPTEDGFKVAYHILELGYWRKHPDLHGYIVETFAGGVDECQEIAIERGSLDDLIKAVTERDLPHTDGFFFGKSGEDDREPTLEILRKVKAWLETKEPNVSREIYYRASW